MLIQKIRDEMTAALRARAAPRLSALRLLVAAVKQREIDSRSELADAEVVAVVEKLIKQRRESIAQFEQARRTELVAGEQFELEVLSEFLPEQLSAEDLARAIDQAIASSAAASIKDMGKVMAVLKSQLAGRADIGAVSAEVRRRLGAGG